MKKVKIGNKIVCDNKPAFIIAEAGSNHNGKLSLAKKLIDIAANAGADAVKFQTFRAEKLYPKTAGKANYLKTRKSIYEIIKNLEMPYNWIPKLNEYCEEKGIMFLSTPFDENSADELEKVGIKAYKIASYCLTHHPLLKHIAKKKKPIILSTGLATNREIKEALNVIYKTGNRDVILMHCVASYPAPLEDANLRAIEAMKKRFKISVGLSDHTLGLIAPLTAVARGANIIEKHFTIDRTLEGPDHKYALEPHELKEMIEGIRDVEKALGKPAKRVTSSEKALYNFARIYVYPVRPIIKGEEFTKKNIAVLRSGKLKPSLHPKHFEKILGRRAKRNIKRYEPLSWSDIK